MAWSRQIISASKQPSSRQVAKRSTNAAVQHVTGGRAERLKPSVSVQMAKQPVPIPREMPEKAIAAVQPADNSAPKSDTPLAKISDLPAGKSTPASSATRTIQEQVAAATELAERATPAASVPAVEQKPDNVDLSDHAEAVKSNDGGKTASAAQSNSEDLVALLIAGPEIKSVPDLADRTIAIEDRQSAFSASVRTAIAAAGAAQIRLTKGTPGRSTAWSAEKCRLLSWLWFPGKPPSGFLISRASDLSRPAIVKFAKGAPLIDSRSGHSSAAGSTIVTSATGRRRRLAGGQQEPAHSPLHRRASAAVGWVEPQRAKRNPSLLLPRIQSDGFRLALPILRTETFALRSRHGVCPVRGSHPQDPQFTIWARCGCD